MKVLRKCEIADLIEGEIWLPIKIGTGYFVSNLGRVSREKNATKILVRQFVNNWGYYRVSIRIEYKKSKCFYVHRLIGEVFVPNPENKPFINHISGIKVNNTPENLEWVTQSENQIHAYKNGLCTPTKGEKSYLSKLTDKIVSEIYNSSLTTKEVMKLYSVSQRTVYRIKRGNYWNHITNKKFENKKRLDNSLVLEIAASTEPTIVLMDKYKMSRTYIDHVRSGRLKSKITGIKFIPQRGSYKKAIVQGF